MDEIAQLKIMAGIGNISNLQEYSTGNFTNTSVSAADKIAHQTANNIKPGDPDWFRLWFSKPHITGETPW